MPKQRQPTRTPLATVTEVGTRRGRRLLQATYPSATSDEVWTLSLDDSGHVTACNCRAGQSGRACWHTHDADNAVIAFYKALYAPRSDDDLAKQAEHLARYLGYPQDQEDRDAAELEAIAVRLLQQERTAAAA